MFDHMAWRTTGTCILCCLDDIQLLLDSQIGKTQSMRASPYIETASLASRHKIALCRLQDWPACEEPIHVSHQLCRLCCVTLAEKLLLLLHGMWVGEEIAGIWPNPDCRTPDPSVPTLSRLNLGDSVT